jgi:translation initiation factor IF-3
MFRGREMMHQEFGRAILERVVEDLADVAVIEQEPKSEGRNMTMVLAPTRLAGRKPSEDETEERED